MVKPESGTGIGTSSAGIGSFGAGSIIESSGCASDNGGERDIDNSEEDDGCKSGTGLGNTGSE